MDPASFTHLPLTISSSRLNPYLSDCAGDLNEALRLYTWNIEISAAFWGELHVLEIALRNAIHDQMVTRYQRSDWWLNSKVKLTFPQKKMLEMAIKRANEGASNRKRVVTPEDTVANSMYAFWSAFLGTASILQFETLYWQPFLKNAFPNYTGKRSDLHQDLDTLRLFRNRIAHHEPIYSRFLTGDHNRILRITGYIHLEVSDYIRTHSRIVDCLERRDTAVQQGVGTQF